MAPEEGIVRCLQELVEEVELEQSVEQMQQFAGGVHQSHVGT